MTDRHTRHVSLILNYLTKGILSGLNLQHPSGVYRRVYNKRLISSLISCLNNIPEASMALEDRSDCILSFVDSISKFDHTSYPDTLGGRYFEFIKSSRNLSSADDLTISSDFTPEMLKSISSEQYYFRHICEFHDLFHVLINADSTIVGEVKIWSFCYGQIPSDYGALINALKLLMYEIFSFRDPSIVVDIINSMAEGIRLGKKARLLFGVDWNKYLRMPICDVRNLYNINC